MRTDDDALTEQAAYYRSRADQYDRDYAERDELQRLLATAETLPISGDVLELACGTGQWTSRLAKRATSVTAVDAAPEVLAIAAERTTTPGVRFVQADLFQWRPSRRYDTVFFGFWLSHVPPARFATFWDGIAAALEPGGRAVFVDDGPPEAQREEILPDEPVPSVLRRLDDGSEHRVVKVFYDPATLTGRLAELGWSAQVRPAEGSFMVGVAEPPPPGG